MKDKTVAILESRAGDRVASLIRKYGGEPFLAPALSEVPDVDPERIRALIGDWESTPPEIFIFQTGVGTRALFAARLRWPAVRCDPCGDECDARGCERRERDDERECADPDCRRLNRSDPRGDDPPE